MHLRLFCFVFLSSLALARADKPLITLPIPPHLSESGYDLILNFETGGEREYNHHPKPEWPGEQSGITVGIGYDCGYASKGVIGNDWKHLDNDIELAAERLAMTAGLKGGEAKKYVAKLQDILINWNVAIDVFNNVDVTRYWQLTRRTYPGFDLLRLNAQAALISITFNRGSDMIGDRRMEMRKIRDCVAKRDYSGMAYWNRKSIRCWIGTSIFDGMARRRDAESRLIETP